MGADSASTHPETSCPATRDQANAIAPLPRLASTISTAVETMKLRASARNSFSCRKLRTSCALGTAKQPTMMTTSAMTLMGCAASGEPSAEAMGLAKNTIAAACTALVTTDTVTIVGARRSMSRSARIRQEETPSSPMLETMAYAVMATVNTPKSRGLRICATTAVIARLATLSKTVVAMLHIAPRRTLAASDLLSGSRGGVFSDSMPRRAGGAVLMEHRA